MVQGGYRTVSKPYLSGSFFGQASGKTSPVRDVGSGAQRSEPLVPRQGEG